MASLQWISSKQLILLLSSHYCRLTILKVWVRSKKVSYRPMFCSLHSLLYLPQHEDHVYTPSVGPWPALAFWCVFNFHTVNRGGMWKNLTCFDCLPKTFPILRQVMKVRKVRRSTMGHCWAASSSPMVSSRGAFCSPSPPCSLSASALCSVRQKRTYWMAFTSISEQMAVYSTFGVSSHAQKPFRNSSLSCCLLTTVPSSPTWR